jgi:Type II secretory pathway, component PulD
LIVADLSAEQFSKLTGELKKAKALEILSRPRVTTIDGQKASVQIGSQVPLTRLEKTPHGEPQRRIDFKNVGEMIVICPHQNDKDSSRLTLDIAATHTEVDKKAELRTGDDTPRFITHQFKLEVDATVGKTLIVAEREPKRGSGRTNSILLAIGPQKIETPAPDPAPPAVTKANKGSSDSPSDLDRLRDENLVLRKQVDELRAKLVDLEVQIRWLRAAAAPGGEDKVSDEVFLRRVYLDLTGLIPTAEETKSFLNDKDAKKRDKLIDSLLGYAAKKETSSGRIKWKDAVARDPEAQPTTKKTVPKETQKDPDSIQMFKLAHSLAADIAQVLAKVLPQAEGLTVGVDERTNSLILRGSPDAMQKAKALLEALDREVDPKKADAKDSGTQEKGALLRELNEADLQAAQATLQAAKANYERFHILRKEEAVSDAELEQARHQLRRAELRLEAAKGVESAKLRELELQEAEARLRSAELALAHAEKLAAKGFLSEVEKDRVRADADSQRVIVENAKLRLKKALEEKPKE